MSAKMDLWDHGIKSDSQPNHQMQSRSMSRNHKKLIGETKPLQQDSKPKQTKGLVPVTKEAGV